MRGCFWDVSSKNRIVAPHFLGRKHLRCAWLRGCVSLRWVTTTHVSLMDVCLHRRRRRRSRYSVTSMFHGQDHRFRGGWLCGRLRQTRRKDNERRFVESQIPLYILDKWRTFFRSFWSFGSSFKWLSWPTTFIFDYSQIKSGTRKQVLSAFSHEDLNWII